MTSPEDMLEERLQSLMELGAISENIIAETIGARVRVRALLEILEEKGVLEPGEFDERAQAVWERDLEELTNEMWDAS